VAGNLQMKIFIFLDQIFGYRFKIWRYLVLASVIVYMLASFSGVFQGWADSMTKAGPFFLVTGFALLSFILLIPTGYLFENFKSAIKIKFVGWVYFVFFAGWVLVLLYLFYHQIIMSDRGVIRGTAITFFGISAYSVFSVPLSVIYFLFGRRE